jgi:hypothetical protein
MTTFSLIIYSNRHIKSPIAYSQSAASLPATALITLRTVLKCGKLMQGDPGSNPSNSFGSSMKKVVWHCFDKTFCKLLAIN